MTVSLLCCCAAVLGTAAVSCSAAVVYPAAGACGESQGRELSFDRCAKVGEGFVREGAEIVCDNGSDATVHRGANWVVKLNQSAALPFTVTAESRALTASPESSTGYSLYLDITYTDDSKLYGQIARFEHAPAKGWQKKTVAIVPDKPVKHVSCYLLYRNVPGGARFRAPRLVERSGSDLTYYDTCCVVRPKGRNLDRPAFLLRDVAATRGFVSVEAGGEAEGISLDVKEETRGGATFFDVTARELKGRDRAVTLVYALPVPEGASASWQANPRLAVPFEAANGGQLRMTTPVGAGEGQLSRWPFGAVTAGGKGMALGIDCSAPAIFRATAHTLMRQLFIAFDLGFAKEHPTAHFRFVRFQFPAEHGFRGALASYNALFPEFAKVRLRRHGLWMAFHKISSVEGWEDFGFAVKEGINEQEWDDAHGITTFRYTEPCTWWMPMPGTAGSYTLADAFMEGDRRAANGEAFARAWRSSAMRDAQGTVIGQVRDTPWCKGVVWSLSPLPALPNGDFAHNFNAAEWSRRYDGKTLPQGVDGEYIDSAECGIPPPLDFNRAHFAYSDTPLAFDPETKAPGVAKCLAIYEYVRAAANRCHSIGRYLMGNCIPLRWPWLVPYSDFGGQETRWIHHKTAQWTPMEDDELLYRRAMSGGKPYCFLMNADFDRFPHELVEKYMQRSLAYGLFACFFSPNASNGHYFSRPELYNRDRNLFRKYVPLCRLVSEAGWRPVNTLAVSDSAGVFAEQFGDRYLTVFNPEARPQEVRLRSLRGAKRAKELVAGGEWRFTGGLATTTIPPETVRLLDFK